MIRMPTLYEAREEAARLTAKGLTVYIYRLRSLPNQGGGGYWLTLATPHEVNAEFVEKITGTGTATTGADR
jgi:hypothetical protein